jgi:hypothetical protein
MTTAVMQYPPRRLRILFALKKAKKADSDGQDADE